MANMYDLILLFSLSFRAFSLPADFDKGWVSLTDFGLLGGGKERKGTKERERQRETEAERDSERERERERKRKNERSVFPVVCASDQQARTQASACTYPKDKNVR